MPIIVMICVGSVWLMAISIYHFIKKERCLKKHQAEWNERKMVVTDLVPDITQDELMSLYLEYCKEIKYRYIPRF